MTVNERLCDTAHEREGRAQSIVTHGDFIIAHLVASQLDLERIDDRNFSWDSEVLPRVGGIVDDMLPRVINAVDTEFGPTSYPITTFKSTEKCRTLVERVLDGVRSGIEIPELPEEYRPMPRVRKQRKKQAVHVLVDSGHIVDGTMLELRAATTAERRKLPQWIADDPRRGRATWVNERTRPLLWEFDGKRYTPTGLVRKILSQVMENPPQAVQGTKYWFVPGAGALVDLADKARDEGTT